MPYRRKYKNAKKYFRKRAYKKKTRKYMRSYKKVRRFNNKIKRIVRSTLDLKVFEFE